MTSSRLRPPALIANSLPTLWLSKSVILAAETELEVARRVRLGGESLPLHRAQQRQRPVGPRLTRMHAPSEWRSTSGAPSRPVSGHAGCAFACAVMAALYETVSGVMPSAGIA